MHIIITRLSRTQDISSGHFVNKKSKFSFKLRKNNKNKKKMYAFFIQLILPIHSWDLNFNSPHCLLFCFLISFELWEFNANEI